MRFCLVRVGLGGRLADLHCKGKVRLGKLAVICYWLTKLQVDEEAS